jgi:hypothetical protein
MCLVLCASNDAAGLWAYDGLRARGVAVELVTADILVNALRWEHRLAGDGVKIAIDLADGTRIDNHTLGCVVNRLIALPEERGATADRGYAAQERFALFLSWLHSLGGRVLNRPTPQGLCGLWLRTSEWVLHAARAGLPVQDCHEGELLSRSFDVDQVARRPEGLARVVVIGDRAVGAPELLGDRCVRLARRVEADMLELRFVSHDGAWVFADATPLPDLRFGGARALALLEEQLRKRVGGEL